MTSFDVTPEGVAERRLDWSVLRQDPVRRVFAIACLIFAVAPLVTTAAIPLEAQPFPDAQEYADGAYQIRNGNGFRTRINEADQSGTNTPPDARYPSRYPPGFPIVLAPFIAIGNNQPSDAQGGARAMAVLLVLALFVAAWTLGGPLAAGIAALVTAFSPFAEESARLVLSDALGAALVLMVLAAVAVAWSDRTRERARSVLLTIAGVLAGYGLLVRVSAAGTLLGLLVATRNVRLLRLVALGAAPFVIFLAVYQWTEFGSPIRSGYDYWLPDLEAYSPDFVVREDLFTEGRNIHQDKLDGALMRWTCPCDELQGPMGHASNVVFYPAVLLGLYWIYFPPLFSVLGIWEIFRRRRSRVGQFAAVVVVLNLAVFLPFFYQGGRLVAPAAYVLLAFSAVTVARVIDAVVARLAKIRARSPSDLPASKPTVEGIIEDAPSPVEPG